MKFEALYAAVRRLGTAEHIEGGTQVSALQEGDDPLFRYLVPSLQDKWQPETSALQDTWRPDRKRFFRLLQRDPVNRE